jgi:hypothetical protein
MLERGGVPVAEELTHEDAKWVRAAASALDDETCAVLTDHIIGEAARAVLEAVGLPDLLALARIIGSAYPNDPGTSDLDDEQPVSITLGDVRRAWAALAKVDR